MTETSRDMQRRIRRSSARRAAGGGGFSSSGDDEYTGARQSQSSGDDLNAEVQSMLGDFTPPTREQRNVTPEGEAERIADEMERQNTDEDDPEFTPAGRMTAVRGRSSRYEREYRLKLLHRLIMRQIPLDKIAESLGVSVQTVMRDRQELFKRLQEEAKNLDINSILGDSIGFYGEVKGMALRLASNSRAPMPLRVSGMRTALAASNDMHKFLQISGFYDVVRYRQNKGKGQDDISKLVQMTKEVMGMDDSAVDEQVKELATVEDDDIQLL